MQPDYSRAEDFDFTMNYFCGCEIDHNKPMSDSSRCVFCEIHNPANQWSKLFETYGQHWIGGYKLGEEETYCIARRHIAGHDERQTYNLFWIMGGAKNLIKESRYV